MDPPPDQQDFLESFALSESAGATGNVLSFTWRELEPSPGIYDLAALESQIAFYAFEHGRRLVVGLELIDTTVRVLPEDLQQERFDSPLLRRRFAALLDAVLPLIADGAAILSIGREVDVYLGYHPEEWMAYDILYEEAVAHVHSAAPRLRVGTSSTFRGAAEAVEPLVADLNRHSDVLILTYYPFGDGFVTLRPETPLTDFPRMSELAGELPIVLAEVGYSSAPELGSSEEAQATFVRSVFAAWTAGRDRISFLSFSSVHDLAASFCEELAASRDEPDPVYATHLCSLGLLRSDGEPKSAWQALVEAAGPTAGP